MTALQYLKEQKLKELRERYPTTTAFDHQANFKDTSEKTLEDCILYFATLEGFQAERIKVKANRIDKRKTYVDAVGFQRTIGTVTWAKSSMQAGSADMSLTIPKKFENTVIGVSVKVEIKIGKDYIKKNQVIYRDQIYAAGGEYWIVKTFEDFYTQYKNFLIS